VYLAKFLSESFGRYLKSCVKNCVKIAIGRKIYFTPQDVFFRSYLFQLIGREAIRKITCSGFAGEGAGSQAFMIINTITFAQVCGLKYLHTPFAKIAHADRPMEQWAAVWEAQFNFGAGEMAANHECEVIDFAYNHINLMRCFGIDELTSALPQTLPELRRKYYLNKSPRSSDVVTVCIHIRRGDVGEADQDMWTSTKVIARTILKIKSIFEARSLPFSMRAFSQGKHDEFSELTALGVELCLDVDAVWTMQELIEADVLIMAKSSFSYVAALMSEGIILAEPRNYTPLDNWLVRGPNGEFDEQSFDGQLQLLIQSKPSHFNVSAVSSVGE
jgi:hypothetical protein